MERLVILNPDDAVTGEDVERSVGMSGAVHATGLYQPGIPFRVLSEQAERAIVEEALAHHGGQMAATARALGLERSHLYKKARALGLRGDKDDEADA
jgi:DNA-binding NtrC family response regulator